ncbi:asparagine synthase-related protein [Geodermatophilus sp. SYSU D01036]
MPASSSDRLEGGPVADEAWYEPTSFEVSVSWVYGWAPDAVVTDPSTEHPAEALRAVLREEVLAGPCVVPFSGGRDSSLVLAVACDVAAEAGVELPTALTFRYPGDPAADEDEWQDLLMDHLRGRGQRPPWLIRDIDDELDVVGPLVAPLLAERGHSLWPPAIGATVAIAQEAAGATVLSGEHGDEVLGARRATILSAAVRHRGRLPSPGRRQALHAALPRGVVAAGILASRRRLEWLTPAAGRRSRWLDARESLHDPLRWDNGVRSTAARRGTVLGSRTMEVLTQRWGSRLAAPLAHPRVLAALASFGGPRGLPDRRTGTRLLSGGSLPEAVCARRTKGVFNGSRFHRHTRAVIERWSGEGVDRRWVDVDALRATWTADVLDAGTSSLLQAAWLAQQGAIR